jgi:O-methyltransferase
MSEQRSSRSLWVRPAATVVHILRAVWQTVLRDWKPGHLIEERCKVFPDIAPPDMAKLMAVEGYTMTSIERRYALLQAVQHLVQRHIEGTMVECGVWHGGSMMLVANELAALGSTERELYLFDTFEGMTSPTAMDQDWTGADAESRMKQDEALRETSHMWCVSPLANVERNMAKTGYPKDRIHLVQGRVEDTIPAQAPAQIALLRLDTDWYESTRHELAHLYDRLVPGGIVIIDDYGYWQGARKAVDEFIAQCPDAIFLNRIDETGRTFVKPAHRSAA